MKKLVFLFGLILLSCCVYALEISPDRISTTIKKGGVDFYEVTITNDNNITESITISSTDTSIALPGLTSLSLPPFEETRFYVIIRGKEGLAYIKISNSDTIKIPIEVNIKEETVGFLEPSFSLYKKTFEEGTETKMRLSLRNHYPEKIEIRDVILEGDVITTAEGISKPIGVEGSFGFLDSEKDLTLDITVNTVNLDPGTYSCKLTVVYYYKNVRYETPVNFEITVIKSLVPTEKEEEKLNELEVLIVPREPKLGDDVVINVVDKKTKEKITDATIRVSEYDRDTGEKIITYTYSGQPIVVDLYRYCVNVTKEGYKSVKKCFQPPLMESKIKIVPEPEVGRLCVVSLVDVLGRPIQDAELEIDGEKYSNQASITFDEGEHKIIGRAKGYKEAEYSFTLTPKFSYSIQNKPEKVGEELVVTFSTPTAWSIEKEENGKSAVIDYGSGEFIEFTPEEAGEYYVIANDEVITSFEVSQPSLLPSIPTYPIIIIIIVVAIILFFVFRPKKEVKAGYGRLGEPREKPSVLKEIEEE
ncbi:MAG TPA: hypothetical protein ENF58_02090 [Candidatus Altiarchaeales archaeon]|nr:hypothetical protein [Candidatus Altiarchaeales archaeon]